MELRQPQGHRGRNGIEITNGDTGLRQHFSTNAVTHGDGTLSAPTSPAGVLLRSN